MPYLPKPQSSYTPPPRRTTNNAERKRFYDSTAWRRVRSIQISTVPYCEACYLQHTLTDCTQGAPIDHIVPINHGGDELDSNNLMTLCPAHHDRKSAMERHQGCLVAFTGEEGYRVPASGEKKRLLTKLIG